MRWPADGVGQLLDVSVGEALGVRAAVEHLEGGDLVLVLVEERRERLDGLGGAVAWRRRRTRRRVTSSLLISSITWSKLRCTFDQRLAQLGVGGERLHGLVDQRRCVACCDLGVAGLGRCPVAIWAAASWRSGSIASTRPCVDRLESTGRRRLRARRGRPGRCGCRCGPGGRRAWRRGPSLTWPRATWWSSFSSDTPRLRSSGVVSMSSVSVTPTASTSTKRSLRGGVGGDGLQVVSG